MISIIVAMARGNVIGKSNDIPWYLPEDLKHFKTKTLRHSVIMGRNTYESIIARIGKPLPERHNIIVTRDETFEAPGCEIVHSIDEAFRVAGDDVFIIGGAAIYEQTIGLVDELCVTEIDAMIDGDVHFPIIEQRLWRETSRESHKKDDKNPYDYSFVIYTRI